MVAAVWVTTTSATTAASGTRLCTVDHDTPERPTCGAPAFTVPSTGTPWASRSRAATSAVERTMPMSAPGMRRSMRSLTTSRASTPSPMARAQPLAWSRWVTT